jgi:amidase
MTLKDTVNAFVSTFALSGAAEGPLAGLTFGAKDLFEIDGHITGYGNPDWARTHPPATATAPAVQALLDAGATLLGKTHTDELAYSLMGANAHYGTPVNSRDPRRLPGGTHQMGWLPPSLDGIAMCQNRGVTTTETKGRQPWRRV